MAELQANARARVVRPEPALSTVDPLLRDYRPQPTIRVAEHKVLRARFPAIDFHNHLGRWLTDDGNWAVTSVSTLVGIMDRCNVQGVVNLDGRWGDELEANLDRYDRAFPGRFFTFCHMDGSVMDREDFPQLIIEGLHASAAAGAKGLKVWKDLGLRIRDGRGELILPDDERLDAVWDAAGQLGLPVLIHTADPVAFFRAADCHNERLEELMEHPEWHFAGPNFPRFERLIKALENVVSSHPNTTFIGAHVGCYPENLDWVHAMLLKYPNFYVDIAGRLAELGRQPRAARRLVVAHPDRVLFGTDLLPIDLEEYRIYFRFLETDDECFAHSTYEIQYQGRWPIAAIALNDGLLRKVYQENAAALLGL